MWSVRTADEVCGTVLRSSSRLISLPQSIGFIRKKMGFTFLGETRHGEHWVIADVRIKNLDKSVCRSTEFELDLTALLSRIVLAYVGRLPEHAVSEMTSRLALALTRVVAVRLMIRPTDDAANDEFWIAIAGSDIDWKNLSTSPEHFMAGVRKLSGLHSLEISEMMTLNYYRHAQFHHIINYPKLTFGPIGLTSG